jgi:hypothetical protein
MRNIKLPTVTEDEFIKILSCIDSSLISLIDNDKEETERYFQLKSIKDRLISNYRLNSLQV